MKTQILAASLLLLSYSLYASETSETEEAAGVIALSAHTTAKNSVGSTNDQATMRGGYGKAITTTGHINSNNPSLDGAIKLRTSRNRDGSITTEGYIGDTHVEISSED